MDNPTETDPDVSRVWKLMHDLGPCMMATHEGGLIRARPMQSYPREGENAIYFLTSAKTHKDDEIGDDDNIALTFQKPDAGKFLSVTATARVLNDRALIRDLWNIAASAWWEGPDDPDIRAIEVTPREAQFWEGPHGVVATIAMVTAAATGGVPVLGEQRKIEMPQASAPPGA